MAKRDMNYIKFIKPQIKEKEKQMKGEISIKQMRKNEIIINTYTVPDTQHNEVCKEAAQMSSRERLMNYAATKDATYLGVGCKWDRLTQIGRDKYGKIIGSLF
jgi:hypothetical protein